MSDIEDQKKSIREYALKFRDALVPDPDLGDAATAIFMQAVAPAPDKTIALYFPLEHELDTLGLAEILWARGNRCLLPVFSKDDREMKFASWTRQTKLSPATFDIPMPAEPDFAEPDILVVPVVAFDQKGNRLGHGKGYYDATLKSLRARREILAVGWAFAEQAVLMKLPTEPHDQKMDMVVTPQRVFDFRS